MDKLTHTLTQSHSRRSTLNFKAAALSPPLLVFFLLPQQNVDVVSHAPQKTIMLLISLLTVLLFTYNLRNGNFIGDTSIFVFLFCSLFSNYGIEACTQKIKESK